FRKPRLAHDQLRAASLEVVEVQLDQPIDHLAFATGDAGHIDAHRPGHHSQARGWVDERDSLGAVDDILAVQTGYVRAGAANHGSSENDGFLALFRQGPGEDFARDPAADHQILNMFNAHDDASRVTGREPLWLRLLRNRDANERIRHTNRC